MKNRDSIRGRSYSSIFRNTARWITGTWFGIISDKTESCLIPSRLTKGDLAQVSSLLGHISEGALPTTINNPSFSSLSRRKIRVDFSDI